ncbi:tetratricopeptide repeat protein [Streptomyces sp. MS1.AVA.3]|uniref:tetratricopeptide repeat protein n=1 Tax=Streptomyces decoyicus TaxID=249567 RepID=UPI0030BE7F84
MLPHVDALAHHTTEDTDTDTTAHLLTETAGFLDNQGQLIRATSRLQRALAGRLRVLGEDHPDTLASRNNLAGSYGLAGDLERAIPLFEQTLTDSLRVLGKDHPLTRTVRSSLANAVPERNGGGPGRP